MNTATANNIAVTVLVTSVVLAWVPTPLPRWITWLGPCVYVLLVYLSWRYESVRRMGDRGQPGLVLMMGFVVETATVLAILGGLSYRRHRASRDGPPATRPRPGDPSE